MRCLIGDQEVACERCARKSLECVFQEHRRGRKRGTKILKKATASPQGISLPADELPGMPSELSNAIPSDPPQPPQPSSRSGIDSRDLQPPGLLNRAATQGRFSLHTVLNSATSESSLAPAAAPNYPGKDPIQLGYVNITIAESLFGHFINVLNPYISQLDPVLHTMDFVRPRSAFLFTVMLAVAAKTFDSATYRTLYDHAETLMAESFRRGDKSVEIAQAIMIMTYWKEPDDTRAWLSLGYVIRMGMDLGWHLLKPVPSRCMSGSNGISDMNDTKERRLRNIQRTWYVLFVYDHSMSLQTGKPWMIERNEFIQSIKDWCRHPLALATDRLLGAFVTIRLLGFDVFQLLRSSVASRSKSEALHNLDPLLNMLEAQLDQWEQYWVPLMEGDTRHTFMVRFYGMHLRLQLFSLPLPRVLAASARDNTPPSSLRILWTCYASALEMLELICRSTQWLFFAQDSIHVMTAYSAAFLVKLLVTAPESITSQIETKVVQTIKATSLAFSLQSAPRASSCALQAHFLEQVLSNLARPGVREKPLENTNNDAAHANIAVHRADVPTFGGGVSAVADGGDGGGPSLFPAEDLYSSSVDASGHSAGQQFTPLDWLLEPNDASNNLFSLAGFDIERGIFFT